MRRITAFVIALEIALGISGGALPSFSPPAAAQDANTQLIDAARSGKTDQVRSLLSRSGTDVNVRNRYGWTPLLWAAMNGHTDTTRLLLAAGANPNTRNKYGWTPLHWAAGQGNNDVVRALLAAGAKVDVEDRNGWTPLMWAWDGKHKETVAILKQAARK